MELAQLSEVGITKVVEYLNQLDWLYIITITIISYFMSRDQLITHTKLDNVKWIKKVRPTLLSVPAAWRVLLVGIIYGTFLHYIRGYHGKDWVEGMVNSLIFAMVFHKLFLNRILSKLDKVIFPEPNKTK